MAAIGQPTTVAASRPAREAPRQGDRRGGDWRAWAGGKSARYQTVKHDQRHIVPVHSASATIESASKRRPASDRRRFHDEEASAPTRSRSPL